MTRLWMILLVLSCALNTQAQRYDSSIFSMPIQMDAVTIKAARGGWDLAGFIRRVRTDTTFFKAFHNLRFINYTATNDIRVLDKKGKASASLFSRTKQSYANGCRTMQVLEEHTTGDFYKHNKEHRYYTSELYDYLFFTHGKVCGEKESIAGYLDERGKGQIEKNKQRLKILMFSPGSKVSGVPLMGDKAAIFEPDVAKMYDFKLSSDEYNGEDCYVFRAIPKKEYADDVVYNDLITWFRKSDYTILARDYSLSYKAGLYDFDVNIKVRTQQVGKRLIPARLEYDGNWHVFSKKRERVRFSTVITP
ncbi:hypothetical protein [Polluticoccus soli]|uniref:hypothetical protein n=1 Tax=Polluticoccus soli TaxID=3034150 RepID=UPI0023E2F39A|nr:hypothetical protein [Flavipsychrobacter sp. JY13-12]